jgi:hypothetical protein
VTGSVDPFHLQVARTALSVADRYGFALGGGLALIVHEIVDRPTEDVDVFGEDGSSVVAATAAVTGALRAAGIHRRGGVPGDPGRRCAAGAGHDRRP